MSKARILHFDIEATSLEASFGTCLCMGYRYNDQKTTRIATAEQFPAKKGEEPDAGLMRHLHDLITNEADILVSWYGKEYDRKFLNARMLMAGLPPMPPLSSEHIDLFFTYRANLKLHSGRLQGVSEALGCPISKTPVRADVWRAAQRGDAKALAYVVDHCKRDVDILHWLYGKLRPYVRQHPPVTPHKDACRVCGIVDWKSNGLRFRMGALQRRLQCKGCGTWTYQNAKGAQVLP
jgi:uncharacterized protein YprB with RNaseH-like and TPR domain